MLLRFISSIFIIIALCFENSCCARLYTKKRILELREEVRHMFQHAYNGYLDHASGYDELRPLTCDGINTWGSYTLTLIDALDTLATMGNYTEFRRVAKILEQKINLDKDINVSVFETNIRIVGGLIAAHLLSQKAGVQLEVGWPCTGPLLRLAEDVARRLLPAFNTTTGMPYGTVNLRYGVPNRETTITCTAGVGTFLVEFGALSRLTGNPIYEDVALNAVHALWKQRSAIGLFGNHIDVQTGRWTAQDAGIGAGVDSFYEYLVKGALLLNRPNLLEMFHEVRKAITMYLQRDDWYVWATMSKGHITLPVFQSLEAYWPGLLSMIGDIKPATRTLVKYNNIWTQYGFLPEFYNIPAGEATANRESYPLRPELAESAMYLYRATKNQFFLEVGENMLHSIEHSAKTPCGYATISNVLTHEKENRMESFFLAETTKYLYLLFDEENFLHNDGRHGDLLQTPNGECVIHSGAYIFNTEAHPIDMSALFCCHDIHEDPFEDVDTEANLLKMFEEAERSEREHEIKTRASKYQCNAANTCDGGDVKAPNIDAGLSVDIEVFGENNEPAAEELITNFEKISRERPSFNDLAGEQRAAVQLPTADDVRSFFALSRTNFSSEVKAFEYITAFMRRFAADATQIRRLNMSHHLDEKQLDDKKYTLWDMYHLKSIYGVKLEQSESQSVSRDDDQAEETTTITASERKEGSGGDDHLEAGVGSKLEDDVIKYEWSLINTTAMQVFLWNVFNNGGDAGDNVETFNVLLNDDEISSLKTNAAAAKLIASHLKQFEYLQKLLKLQRHLTKSLQGMEKTIPESESAKEPSKERTDDLQLDRDDSNAAMTKEKLEKGVANLLQKGTNIAGGWNRFNAGESIWSLVVRTIVETTTPKRRKEFDEALFLVRTRASLDNYDNVVQNYSLLTCPAPSFVSKFAYREFYP